MALGLTFSIRNRKSNRAPVPADPLILISAELSADGNGRYLILNFFDPVDVTSISNSDITFVVNGVVTALIIDRADGQDEIVAYHLEDDDGNLIYSTDELRINIVNTVRGTNGKQYPGGQATAVVNNSTVSHPTFYAETSDDGMYVRIQISDDQASLSDIPSGDEFQIFVDGNHIFFPDVSPDTSGVTYGLSIGDYLIESKNVVTFNYDKSQDPLYLSEIGSAFESVVGGEVINKVTS